MHTTTPSHDLQGPSLPLAVPPAGHPPRRCGLRRGPGSPLQRRLAAAALGLALGLAAPAATAAESIVFVSGAFRRSIAVSDLAHLAETGQATGLLQDVMRFGRQDPQAVAKLLNQSVNLPVVLLSRLLNTRIGEVLLQRLSQIVYPLRASGSSVPALRAAVILGSTDNTGKGLTAISFLRAYPSQELAVSLPALLSLMSKSGSITDLVRFFSESPLDGLRGDQREAPPAATPPAASAPAATP
ncbi:MAG: alpha/beta hydrolase [Cyanobium sp.]